MQYYIKTFGCQMNELDSETMAYLLSSQGHRPAGRVEEADIVLFNTCTVREKSRHKAISETGKVLKEKRKRGDTIVGIVGCVAQEEKEGLFDIFPDLDIVLGPDQIHHLIDLIDDRHTKHRQATSLVNKFDDYTFISPTPQNAASPAKFIKIMKGCDKFCTFCIVPYVRGREVSRSAEDIIEEIRRLEAVGTKEVTLLGQNVNSYVGNDPKCQTFPELLRKIAEETNILRVRYTSPHPHDLSDQLIEEHRTNPVVCEHIHLPVQSGSGRVLKNMRRSYTREGYLKKVSSVRASVPDIAITTDLIVGFPGETEDDFQETLSLMKEVEFDGMFAFKYSERKGTAAAKKFENDVPAAVKSERLARVLDLNKNIILKKHQTTVGSLQEILVEGISSRGGSQLTGRTRTNTIVNFEGEEELIGRLVNVRIESASENSLKGSKESLC